jgi:hypothetical protein
METVYKLVKRVDDKLVSIRTKGAGQVEYKLNKLIQSPKHLRDKGYHLCIIKELELAEHIQSLYEKDSIILECKAKDTHETGMLPYLCSDDLNNGTFDSQDGAVTWPSMCRVMAKKIRPIKEVS